MILRASKEMESKDSPITTRGTATLDNVSQYFVRVEDEEMI